MIAVVDYGAGNLTSVMKALDHLGAKALVTSDPACVSRAEKIILPGVGHFAATTALENGVRASISNAIERNVPFLGICVGMQWMCSSSQEAAGINGLGLIRDQCERFPSGIKCPHVGWNALHIRESSRLLRGVPTGSFVYFTHSYRVPLGDATSAEAEYGGRFSAALEQGSIFGVQFHPEKSGEVGLAVLRNFLAC
jgi:imidazole glycerol-phosphate synthase subunit HisH